MEIKYYIVEFLVRLFCGIIFLFQGFDKLFTVKMTGVVDSFSLETSKLHVPRFLVFFVAFITSMIEFLGGAMLILGLYKNIALTLLGIDIIIVTVAFSFLNPIWDMRHVFPRLLLISLLMIMPDEWFHFGIENLLRT
jgi:putative oxidoreductase